MVVYQVILLKGLILFSVKGPIKKKSLGNPGLIFFYYEVLYLNILFLKCTRYLKKINTGFVRELSFLFSLTETNLV